MKNKPKVLVVCGGTAMGKTGLALQLASQFGGELVSCDSRQVYRGMDVVTGKDILEGFVWQKSELWFEEEPLRVYAGDGVKIWGYDVVTADGQFSATGFVEMATMVVEEIVSRQALPIIVGGTGMYLQSWLDPKPEMWVPADRGLREQLSGWDVAQLQARLTELDAIRWKSMNASDAANPRRLMRAIEVALYVQDQGMPACPSPATERYELQFVLLESSKELHDRRIEQRVLARLGEQMDEEVRRLQDMGAWDGVAMQTLGYAQWAEYLSGKLSQSEAVAAWQTAEKQYARRQRTWFAKYLPADAWRVNVDEVGWQDQILEAVQAWNVVE